MLGQLRAQAALAVQDLERAKQFYKDKLGLTPSMESNDGAMYNCADGTGFLLYPTSTAGTAKNTVMGWETTDLETEMNELRNRGVVFEEYDFPGLKTEDGIATSPVGRSAWFRDSEGNTLALSQFTS